MTWDQIDLATGVWRKPASSTKQKREHVCPLNPQALAVLRKRLDYNIEGSPFVFPGTGGTGHLVEIKKSWATIRREAGLGDCRMHDLRHSYAATLASSGVGLLVIGRLLGHSNPTTTNRYAHLTDDAARDAANMAGKMIGRR